MEDQSIFFRIPKAGAESFIVQHDKLAHFYDRLHYHPEFQLVYVAEGTGSLFASETITPFGPGNLFLIGPNQSHVFKSDREFYDDESNYFSRSVSVFFNETLMNNLFSLEELFAIREFLKRAQRGISFLPEISRQAGRDMEYFIDQAVFPRFLNILSLLNKLAWTSDYHYLASAGSSIPMTDSDNQKVDQVINYILSHYTKEIKLEEVAGIANYSKAAFCHFFKARTRKTFLQFLIEVRVSQACKLLRSSDLNISQICYECGFNNLSNFNRQFKKVTGLSPMGYLRKLKDTVAPR